MNSPNKKVKYLSTKQVSDYLGLHPRTIQRLAKKGKIRFIRLGRLFKYRESDIKKYFENGIDFPKEPIRIPNNFIERSDRRSYPRINSNFKCQYSISLSPFKNINSEGIIKNLSAGGVFLIDQDNGISKIDIDDPINLDFILNNNGKIINIKNEGRIVRKDNIGLGIKFRNMSEEVIIKIIQYIG